MYRTFRTFTRSRTPTGAEMKTQSSLEVPKQVRSASFDEIKLEAQKAAAALMPQNSADNAGSLLQVPQGSSQQQRSHSFDSASATGGDDSTNSFLDVPRRFQRRRSSSKTPPLCIHCQYLEEYKKKTGVHERVFFDQAEVRSYESTPTTSDDDEDYYDEDDDDNSSATTSNEKLYANQNTLMPPASPHHGIVFTLSPTSTEPPGIYPPYLPVEPPPLTPTTPGSPPLFPSSPTIELPPGCEDFPNRQRRRSISRQEAIFVEPTGNSLENVAASDKKGFDLDKVHSDPAVDCVVSEIFLAVPDLKRDRAASVDSCFSKVSQAKTEELKPPEDGCLTLTVPTGALRSRSVDIVLPTEQQARYKALALAQVPVTLRKTSDGARQIRCTPDWGENAVSGDHLWTPTSFSSEACYLGESDCTRTGARMKCSACKINAHVGCISALMERQQLACKPTFRDVGVRQYREQTKTHHHWIHRRTEKGKCKQCGKSLQAKLSFSSKEIVALSCAWCKSSYHNKEACFNPQRIGEECTLGVHSQIIVPPSWIVKLPRKGSFKSSLRRTPKKKTANKKKSKEKEQKTFVIKPIPTSNVTPVLVFINPKSGGNQGAKLLQKFQWLLNPRQVFDLTQGGPKLGLELFRKVPNLRVLACGGDGTVGWVLSILDQINFIPPPAVGVLPLGTGNDLARALGWGGGYTDEPIGKILQNIGDSDTVLLDRWNLKVEPNPNAPPDDGGGKDLLPLSVVNNYYSLGVDAHIALEFHEAREAHPEKFNSRLRNKMFYGQAGGKDLLKRKWKGLAEFVTLECDGKDLTPKLKEHKVHAIVFLNIPSYGGGTHPWNKSGGQHEPTTDDGMIEVVGLTTYQLPLLQAGGHGTCIAQCRSAKVVTLKTIPMQVDGEACKLKPSIIELTLLNKAVMLAKRKPGRTNVQQATLESLNLSIYKLSMADYEQNHHDKDALQKYATILGNIDVNPVSDLEQIRVLINRFCEELPDSPKLSPDWCFVDYCTAERCFRIDRAQENLHYIMDIAHDCIYILDQECQTMPQTPDDDTASPASMHLGSSLESHGTPGSPGVKFFNRSLSGAGSGGTSDSLSPAIDGQASRKSSQGSQGSMGSPKSNRHEINGQSLESVINFKRIHERLFGLNEDAFGFSNLLEKTTDAVIKAARHGDLVLLKDLHSQGYSLLSIDASGQTALHHGARYGHKEIVRYLISFAPNSIINMVDNETGQTALHKAAANRRRSICYMLVAAGASLVLQDNLGYTPKILALNIDDHELAAYLDSQERFQNMNHAS